VDLDHDCSPDRTDPLGLHVPTTTAEGITLAAAGMLAAATGPDVDVAASMDSDAFLVSGCWPGWEASGAAGSPVVVTTDDGDSDVTQIGLDVTFRGHPENTFRVLGNGILEGLD
jgi:hypothetical protein